MPSASDNNKDGCRVTHFRSSPLRHKAPCMSQQPNAQSVSSWSVHPGVTASDAGRLTHVRGRLTHTPLDASNKLCQTCCMVYAVLCMEVWVNDAPDAINGQHTTSDAKGVNNPYLVPAIVTYIPRALKSPRPRSLNHTSLTAVQVATSVMQHCLSAKGNQKTVVPIAFEQPCMTLVNSHCAARDQHECQYSNVSLREVVSLPKLLCPSKCCQGAQPSLCFFF